MVVARLLSVPNSPVSVVDIGEMTELIKRQHSGMLDAFFAGFE